MKGCVIVGENMLIKLVHRYDGLGKPLSNDEREILLFALYNESEARSGGIVEKARSQYAPPKRVEVQP